MAQHTPEKCVAWEEQRRMMRAAVWPNLSLPAVVRAMTGSGIKWKVVASFCENVMSRKEAAEQKGKAESKSPATVRRRREGEMGALAECVGPPTPTQGDG